MYKIVIKLVFKNNGFLCPSPKLNYFQKKLNFKPIILNNKLVTIMQFLPI